MVTSDIESEIAPLLQGVSCGMLNVFLQHTSASLTINENCDPDVRVDMETFLNLTVPEGRGSKVPWTHTAEGPGTSATHVPAFPSPSSPTISLREGQPMRC